jgi:predicted RNA binding protein with dsRBD fold (UPF0201 family)
MSTNVTAESLVNPTEDPSKVERALHNLFPYAPVKRTNLADDVIKLEVGGNSLEFLSTLRNLIKQERITNAARRILLNGMRGNQIRFYLNKQATFVGRVSFCEPVGESPLGPISIRIEAMDPLRVVDFLASIPR